MIIANTIPLKPEAEDRRNRRPLGCAPAGPGNPSIHEGRRSRRCLCRHWALGIRHSIYGSDTRSTRRDGFGKNRRGGSGRTAGFRLSCAAVRSLTRRPSRSRSTPRRSCGFCTRSLAQHAHCAEREVRAHACWSRSSSIRSATSFSTRTSTASPWISCSRSTSRSSSRRAEGRQAAGRHPRLRAPRDRVQCLPADIPEKIEIDVSELLVNQAVRVRDLAVDPKWKPVTDGDVMLVPS